MSATHHCQVCGNKNIQRFFEMPPMPTQDGIMCDSREDALAFPSGSIDLHFCHDCSYIGNEGYEPDKISFDAYDFSLDHSPLFGQYIEGLADALIETYGLRQKQILDIGCGDGGFLEVICRRGNNRGIGIDSGFDHSRRKKTEGASIRYIQDYYSEKYRELAPDFVCCRLVIDLLDDPGMILRSIRQNLEGRPNVPVFIEVPSAQYTFGERVIWNVVYEHRSWFSPVSLTCLMESCGFEVVETKSLWNDEFIGVVGLPNREAKPASVVDKEVQKMKKMIRGFRQDFAILLERSSSQLQQIKREGIRTLAWGAGARGVTFLNLFELGEHIQYIVDINTKRQGKFVPGSAQQIVAPEFICDFQPQLIVITNPTYADEIKQQVKDLGVESDFWVL